MLHFVTCCGIIISDKHYYNESRHRIEYIGYRYDPSDNEFFDREVIVPAAADANGKITLEVENGKNFTLVVED